MSDRTPRRRGFVAVSLLFLVIGLLSGVLWLRALFTPPVSNALTSYRWEDPNTFLFTAPLGQYVLLEDVTATGTPTITTADVHIRGVDGGVIAISNAQGRVTRHDGAVTWKSAATFGVTRKGEYRVRVDNPDGHAWQVERRPKPRNVAAMIVGGLVAAALVGIGVGVLVTGLARTSGGGGGGSDHRRDPQPVGGGSY